MKFDEASLEDRQAIRSFLGREVRGLLGVAKRCPGHSGLPKGHPGVIVTYPLLGTEPFPTTFWLVCPVLNKAVSALESQGWVGRFKEKIASDQDARKRLKDANRKYAALRLGLLKKEECRALEENHPGIYEAIKSSGIGGVRNWDGIKCLHAHYAFFLAGYPDPVGEWVDRLLRKEGLAPSPDARESAGGWRHTRTSEYR